ncbi:MAG TPA: tRNA pseudouridine(38-40) synthase TruA [Thermoanaerobaculia bacterium]|nr:tRNA pseudouridine(38-40) synthase TruA [Thermoanaerobaculia bacterium]
MRILLTIQYLGTRYAGWQTQANAVGVQQIVSEALTRMFVTPVRLEGAGRTDAGVHARAQRAHADVPFPIPPRGLIQGLNTQLPEDIRVTEATEVGTDFHARFAAIGKTYLYRIWNDAVADVFSNPTHEHVAQPLDAGAMQDALRPLLGHHDFRAFTVASPEVSTTWRTLEKADVRREGTAVIIEVRADGYLRYMVRRIAGSLIEVGLRKLDRDALARSLEPSFEVARWTAAAKGLTLWDVHYQ